MEKENKSRTRLGNWLAGVKKIVRQGFSNFRTRILVRYSHMLKNTGQLDEIAYYQFEARDDRARKRINRRFLIKAIQAKCSSLTAQTLSRTQFTVPIGEEQAASLAVQQFLKHGGASLNAIQSVLASTIRF
ncbi:hypothetical protein K0M31_018588 [Melipona bicolor]|uniref:Uncharacterized protein n=1 Tax=Melipona bicolor TaxID=60889 RepID=A0AA40G3V4_9HYME|nr:hypothetical protein K0M31_018588 [Melipona bicolor]